MKKVLYITYDGLTDPLGQSQVLPYLQYLSEKGYRFTILSFEKQVRLQKEGPLVQAIVNKANIEWKSLLFTSRPPILSKIYDRYRMENTAIALHKKEKFDLVHCRSYVAAEIGLQLKKKFGIKMLFDMRGFWADEKVDNGQWDQKNLLYKRIYRHYKIKEKEFLLHADGIVSLTQAARNYLLQLPAYKQLSIDVIPCCADLHHFDYARVETSKLALLRERLGIAPNKKVIAYLGSVGGWYMTKEMFAFFLQVLNKHHDYVMLVLTKDDSQKVLQEAKDAGIPREKLKVTYANRNELPEYIALSTCSIFFIRDTFSKTASSPTKHGELMGMGIPVICNDIGDTGDIIKATGTGLLVNNFDTLSLEKASDEIIKLEKLDKASIRSCAKKYFDLTVGAEKYASLYKDILS